jgi:hypothetical protein
VGLIKAHDGNGGYAYIPEARLKISVEALLLLIQTAQEMETDSISCYLSGGLPTFHLVNGEKVVIYQMKTRRMAYTISRRKGAFFNGECENAFAIWEAEYRPEYTQAFYNWEAGFAQSDGKELADFIGKHPLILSEDENLREKARELAKEIAGEYLRRKFNGLWLER